MADVNFTDDQLRVLMTALDVCNSDCFEWLNNHCESDDTDQKQALLELYFKTEKLMDIIGVALGVRTETAEPVAA